jgi:exopolyphosphatase/guanosine-5'-triphosphate,3'-diphosphate pyrophosphatase
VRAAIDLGSNSIHLLVAAVARVQISPIVDESAFVGLGSAAENGTFGPTLADGIVVAVGRFVDVARHLDAATIAVAGTEPFRRAADAGRVVRAIERQLGVPCHVLDHREEALLTLLGVTAGRRVRERLLVADVGGGSTELCVVAPGGRAWVRGVRVGSAALTARHVTNDPPTAEEIAALRSAAHAAFAPVARTSVDRIVVVGGTATNVIRLLPMPTTDRRLNRGRLAEAMGALAEAPATAVAEAHAVRPERARVLAAGCAILEALLERFGLDVLDVSEAGIREGLVFATARAGISWRDRLEALAHGSLAAPAGPAVG